MPKSSKFSIKTACYMILWFLSTQVSVVQAIEMITYGEKNHLTPEFTPQYFNDLFSKTYRVISKPEDIASFLKTHQESAPTDFLGRIKIPFPCPQSLYIFLYHEVILYLYKNNFSLEHLKNVESITYISYQKIVNEFLYDDIRSLCSKKNETIYSVIQNTLATWVLLAKKNQKLYKTIVSELNIPNSKAHPQFQASIARLISNRILIKKILHETDEETFKHMISSYYKQCFIVDRAASAEETMTITVEILRTFDLRQIKTSKFYEFIKTCYMANESGKLGYSTTQIYSAILYLETN